MAMSNTLTDIIPQILARGLRALRTNVLMTRLVNTDYSEEAKKKGSTIDVPYSTAKTASDVTPAATPPAPDNTEVDTVPITLSNWKHSSFGLTDKELGQIEADEWFLPVQAQESFQAIAAAINQSVFACYKGSKFGVYGFTGTAGSTPFASAVTDATNLRKVLNKQRCPKGARMAVLDWDAEGNALALSPFSDAEKIGSGDVKIEGEIGKKYGFWWNADDDVPTHTAGTITAGLAAKTSTSQPVGSTSITATTAASTGACALKQGDIIHFAGDDQTYTLLADATQASPATDVSLSIFPGLKVALSGDEAITVEDSHVVNLGFHRDAFALAMRQPDEGLSLKGKYAQEIALSSTLSDPISGLVFRLELIRQYKQWMWDVDALWGGALVRPEYAGRLAG